MEGVPPFPPKNSFGRWDIVTSGSALRCVAPKGNRRRGGYRGPGGSVTGDRRGPAASGRDVTSCPVWCHCTPPPPGTCGGGQGTKTGKGGAQRTPKPPQNPPPPPPPRPPQLTAAAVAVPPSRPAGHPPAMSPPRGRWTLPGDTNLGGGGVSGTPNPPNVTPPTPGTGGGHTHSPGSVPSGFFSPGVNSVPNFNLWYLDLEVTSPRGDNGVPPPK